MTQEAKSTIPFLSRIFKPKESVAKASIPMDTSIQQFQSSDSINSGESYVNYGRRICAATTASSLALPVYLQKVYNYERQRQITDEEVQETAKKRIRNDLTQAQAELEMQQNNQNATQESKEKKKDKISDLMQKFAEVKNGKVEENKMARLKMILGLCILIPLTLYLFIFYSSTFYSAFFRNFTNGQIKVGTAMFDANALSAAYLDGTTELIFILCAPIIFLGLGFSLHFFTIQKGTLKWFKMAAVIIVTFIFDCILAYLIAQKIYVVEGLNKLENQPPFDIYMAITDSNVWAVIFCGFIVYIIWGIVFDMTISAYEDTKSNKKDLEAIQIKIDNEENKLEEIQNKLTGISNQITQIKAKIKALESNLAKSVHYDLGIIQTAFNDFFSGWVTMMAALECPDDKKNEAKSLYEKTFAGFFEENPQTDKTTKNQQA